MNSRRSCEISLRLPSGPSRSSPGQVIADENGLSPVGADLGVALPSVRLYEPKKAIHLQFESSLSRVTS